MCCKQFFLVFFFFLILIFHSIASLISRAHSGNGNKILIINIEIDIINQIFHPIVCCIVHYYYCIARGGGGMLAQHCVLCLLILFYNSAVLFSLNFLGIMYWFRARKIKFYFWRNYDFLLIKK
jgi:hypothetical protein